MISMAILALAFAIAAPNLSTWLTNQKISAAAEQALALLQAARSEALARNATVSAYLVDELTDGCMQSSKGHAVIVATVFPESDCASLTAPRLIKKASLDKDRVVTVIALAGAEEASSVAFNGLGRVSSPIGAISAIDFDALPEGHYRKLRVEISSGGSARICYPAVGSTTNARACSQ